MAESEHREGDDHSFPHAYSDSSSSSGVDDGMIPDRPIVMGMEVDPVLGYYGPRRGHVKMYQYSNRRHNDLCKTDNQHKLDKSENTNGAASSLRGGEELVEATDELPSLQQEDNTGLRFYAGCHIAIRFLASPVGTHLIKGKTVCEIGCGTGALGLIGALVGSITRNLVLTDGNERCRKLVEHNMEEVGSTFSIPTQLLYAETKKRCSYETLLWDDNCSIAKVIEERNNNAHFDVVIASELTYYLADMTHLLNAVSRLTGGSGIFLHSHFFRNRGQAEELQSLFESIGWKTLEFNVESFVEASEMAKHPEWYRCRCLMTISKTLLESIAAQIGIVDSDFDVKAFEEDTEEDRENELYSFPLEL